MKEKKDNAVVPTSSTVTKSQTGQKRKARRRYLWYCYRSELHIFRFLFHFPPLPWRFSLLLGLFFLSESNMKHWKFSLFLPRPLSPKCHFVPVLACLPHGRAFYLLFFRVHPSHLTSFVEISTGQGRGNCLTYLPTFPCLSTYLPTYLLALLRYLSYPRAYLSNQLSTYLPTKLPNYSIVLQQPKTLTNM